MSLPGRAAYSLALTCSSYLLDVTSVYLTRNTQATLDQRATEGAGLLFEFGVPRDLVSDCVVTGVTDSKYRR